MKQIPSSFKLGPHTISIEWDASLLKEDCTGKTDYQMNKVSLYPSTDSFPITQPRIEHVFWHEIVHWILYSMNEDELRENEKFVDELAGKIMQVVNSFEYSKSVINHKKRKT